MQIKYILSALPLISCSSVAALGVFVLAQNKRGRVHFLFAALCLSLCVYNFGAFLMYILEDPAAAAAASTICIASTALLIGLLPHFIFAFVSHNGGAQKLTAVKLSFFYAAAALVMVLTLKGLVASGVSLTATGYISQNGPYFIFYAAAIAFSGLYSILYLYYWQAGGADDYKLNIRYVLLGVLISFLFGIFDILKKIAGIFTEVSTLEYGIIIFCALSAYAIVKHKFLHIEFAVKKGVLYSILMILVALTVLSVAVAAEQITQNWLDSSSFSINLLNAFIVGFFFDPVKDRLQRILNKYFFPRLTNIELDETLIKNKAVLECIAGEKIDELKLLKTNIERIINEYEQNH
jgi:hypothetical protein